MKQKICIIAALIHNPKFWVLDEPLMGLDPQSTYEIKQYMKEHKKLGNSVFFSSHNIDMVEKLCDRVAIINRGQLMEIIDVKKFLKESPVPLEDYFLNMTRESKAKVIAVEDNKNSKRKKFSDFWHNLFKKKKKEEQTTTVEAKESVSKPKTKSSKKNISNNPAKDTTSDILDTSITSEPKQIVEKKSTPRKKKSIKD